MVINPRKTAWDEMAEWWDKEAGEKGIWHQQHDIDPVMFKLFGTIKNKMILEMGCGNGYFSRLLAKKGAKVIGIDLSKELIGFAIEKEKLNPLGIKYLVRDAANLHDLRSRSFDIVVANMCLMDIADAKGALKEASRVLKKNGRIIFSITHPVFDDYAQQWTIIKEKGKKYFARAIYKYLSLVAWKFGLWASGVKTTQYHRPLETYFIYLRNAGFLVDEFREIATKKKIKKATKETRGVRLRRSRYTTLIEKKMKELAGKEIPLFLVVRAVKIK